MLWLLSAVMAATLAAGGIWLLRGPAEPALRVGPYAVSDEQLELRRRHVAVLYPDSAQPEVAAAQLVQGYLSAVVLAKYGTELDRRTWEAEALRVDRETRDPEMLGQLKAVYAADQESYLTVGLLPDFAQSRLFRYYRSASRFAEESRRRAAAFLDEAEQNPAEFEALAAKLGGLYRKVEADPELGLIPFGAAEDAAAPELRDESPRSRRERAIRARMAGDQAAQESAAARMLISRLGGVAAGAVYPRTLETGESFEAARVLDRRADGTLVVELVSFAKPDYGAWFWSEARTVPVVIRDAGLRDALRAKAAWAKDLQIAAP